MSKRRRFFAGPPRGQQPKRLEIWRWGSDGAARIEFAADGLPSRLRQQGWVVDYLDWDHAQQPPLPRRLVASRDEHRVRLVVLRWDAAP